MPALNFRRRFFYGRRLKPEDTAAGVEKGTGGVPSPDRPETRSYASPRKKGLAASPRKKQLSRRLTLPRSLSKISIAPDPAILNADDLGEIVMEIVLATGLRAPNGSTIGQAPSPFVKLAVRGKEHLNPPFLDSLSPDSESEPRTMKLSCAVDSLSYRQRRSSPSRKQSCKEHTNERHEKQQWNSSH